MESVKLTIDGRQVSVERGRTVLQAAIETGISLPYYCYHPGIGIDGSCRVCVVKIEKMPKLQTSCSTVCAEGMVVHTRSADVVAAREGVFEFLLINHPLDCPVCDKGGECPLQDFAYTFGVDQSRMEFPRRVFDGEGVRGDVDFGPTLMLNRQRCILCTRCVRFMRDVDADAQINIIDRGYGSEIATFNEQGVHTLLSGNLVDVCPVGAITAKDYRFQSRPWDNTSVADTVCTQCSVGCNTTAWMKAKPEWAKGARLIRFTPRFNAEVNGYWMCDIGRYGYHWIEGDRRIRRPLERHEAGALEPSTWHELVSKLAGRLAAAGRAARVKFLLSAHGSHEELFLFKRLTEEWLGPTGPEAITVGWRVSSKSQPEHTRFRVSAEDAPNVAGARMLGLASPEGEAGTDARGAALARLRAAAEAGAVSALYVFDPGPEGSLGDTSWIVEARTRGRLPLLIVQGILMTDLARAADFVLPGASFVEKEASYTNDQGRLQGTARALAAPGEALEDWKIVVDLGVGLGARLLYASADQVRSDIVVRFADVPGFEGLTRLRYARPVSARTWLQSSNPSERWKWDVMYQDLPPVRGAVDASALPAPPGTIPLREVK